MFNDFLFLSDDSNSDYEGDNFILLELDEEGKSNF